MTRLILHEFHQSLNGRFTEVNGSEAVNDYGDALQEHAWLRDDVGLLDLSFRSRLVIAGTDRKRFLHGQVTNNVSDLRPGEGCYAALVTPKGKMQSDLNIYCLENELLLDFEPGLTERIAQRFEKYIVADDVQVVEVAPHYGLVSIQGPKAHVLLPRISPGIDPPGQTMSFVSTRHPAFGELYFMNHPRTGTRGFDCYVPVAVLDAFVKQMMGTVASEGGHLCGWQALEIARIEAGIPRFGADMDETNLPPEVGIEDRAVSYTKGCYIGQEVIARIRTYGQVAKALRGLRLADDLKLLPKSGDKIFRGDKEIGYVTSALASPTLKSNIALGYVRREHNQIGTELCLRTAHAESMIKIVTLPFVKN
jgi:folate-binding protein YgfZ